MVEYLMGEQMKVKLKNMRLCLSLESSDTICPIDRNGRGDGWCNIERSRIRRSVCVRRMESATKIGLIAESVRTVSKSCMSSEDGNETLRWKEIEVRVWGNAPFLKHWDSLVAQPRVHYKKILVWHQTVGRTNPPIVTVIKVCLLYEWKTTFDNQLGLI